MSTQPDGIHRPPAVEAATTFVNGRFHECLAAFLAGSASRGEASHTSDLDLVIVNPQEGPSRWATFRVGGWPVEAWFLTPDSYAIAFAEDAKRRWPLLPEMCQDGIILWDREGLAAQIKAAAAVVMAQGPEPLSHAEMDRYRFDLTSMLEDFEGSNEPVDALLVAGGIFHVTATLILAMHRRWLGQGRWLIRTLRTCAPEQAERLEGALSALSRQGDRMELVQVADAVLNQMGGRLFEGQSQATWWRT
jgi:hypothetical protein